ncbi:pterin-4-alpha-carbinolamine dehydratase [Haloactinopolyspora alba]|uniref:Putative pterin-4-alpha-carbinolamine dehydratase n=1 Tax=Haloactinopolyspora alba TaxID=648780 RepID=A0A2P8DWL6_9ACTN|nr:4a-hydroxytetrahydrobiopterin dehydratase [Haloactinopolyspora alba]PSL01594.1 pterin-4-alpha-carbinolamine dehydratase [Haloactinopolyspora alba]
MPELLTDQELATILRDELSGWSRAEGSITKTWKLKGFFGALVLANAVGHVCNAMNHHPDLSVHDYNQLTVTLTTHDAGGVTEYDIDAARRIERVAA